MLHNITERLPVNRTLLTRLFAKICVSTTTTYQDIPCWEWTACLNRAGYGNVGYQGRTVSAYKLFFELFVHIVPKPLTLDHLCRNRKCVNPAHLEPVTNKENVLRGVSPMAINAAKTHCINGHPFDEANTYFRRNNKGRDCKMCRNLKGQALQKSRPFDHPQRIKNQQACSRRYYRLKESS